MGGRRRFIRRTLAALAALVLLGGIGVGVWAASTDDDEPVQTALGLGGAGSGEDGSGEDAPAGEAGGDAPARGSAPAGPEQPAGAEPTEPEPPDPVISESPEPAPEAQPEPELGSEPEEPASPGSRETTRFRRERNEDPDRRGREFAVPPAREFTGTGNALIGTVNVSSPAIVRWRSRGRFGLEFGREAFPIVAPSRSGQLVVPPFRFELVRVIASGRWTITVTPQG